MWLDARGEHLDAIKAYRTLIKQGVRLLDPYLNAAFLCWELTDPGISASFKLTRDRVSEAWDEAFTLLRTAARLFPEECEAWFWERYFKEVSLGEDEFVEEYLQRVRRSEKACMSLFYLAQQRPGEVFVAEIEELAERARVFPTQKNRYVAHMAQGALERSRMAMKL